MIYLSGVNTLL